MTFKYYRALLWFDVGIKRYTTVLGRYMSAVKLWFDVGIKRYTTMGISLLIAVPLWFDVGIKRYTTYLMKTQSLIGCGLM